MWSFFHIYCSCCYSFYHVPTLASHNNLWCLFVSAFCQLGHRMKNGMFNVQKIHLKKSHVMKQFLVPPSLTVSIDQTIFYHPLSQISVQVLQLPRTSCNIQVMPCAGDTVRLIVRDLVQKTPTAACFEMKFSESFLSLQLSVVKGDGLKLCSCVRATVETGPYAGQLSVFIHMLMYAVNTWIHDGSKCCFPPALPDFCSSC